MRVSHLPACRADCIEAKITKASATTEIVDRTPHPACDGAEEPCDGAVLSGMMVVPADGFSLGIEGVTPFVSVAAC